MSYFLHKLKVRFFLLRKIKINTIVKLLDFSLYSKSKISLSKLKTLIFITKYLYYSLCLTQAIL